jgi:hypothetical protein
MVTALYKLSVFSSGHSMLPLVPTSFHYVAKPGVPTVCADQSVFKVNILFGDVNM